MARGATNAKLIIKNELNIVSYEHSEDQVLLIAPEIEEANCRDAYHGNWTIFSPTSKKMFQADTDECNNMMEDKEFLKRVKNMNVDLVIVGAMPIHNCHYLIPHHLNIPYISAQTVVLPWFARVPALPSVTPSFDKGETDKLSFLQRLRSFFLYLLLHSGLMEANIQLLKKYHPEISSYSEFVTRAKLSISFVDHHLDWPSPSMPNYIRIPGITITPGKPLPTKLKAIADDASKGIIVFSFGTSGAFMPETTILKFFDAFSQLEQTVFMRLASLPPHLSNYVPANTVVLNWLPQNDLLAHPNTIVFITHCGNNGQYESLYHGVPMLGIPLFAEQHHNAFRMVAKGFGLTLDIMNFTSKTLQETVVQLIQNETYKANIMKQSAILKDRPMLPKEEAAYWVEHILKFGADHLATSGTKITLFKFFCLDLLLFILILLFCVGAVTVWILKHMINYILMFNLKMIIFVSLILSLLLKYALENLM